ncbi:hypothetical protein Tco_0972496 [Tanacetum coccineum]
MCRLASRSTPSGIIRMVFTQEYCGGQDMTPLPSRDQRHPWLRYQVEGYTEDIVHNFEQRLETIFGRSVNRVHILDFAGLTEEMMQTLDGRLRMVYTGDEGQELLRVEETIRGGARRRILWRQFILALGLHTSEEMAEDGFETYWLGSERVIPDKGDLRDYWIDILSDRDFLGPAPSYVYTSSTCMLRGGRVELGYLEDTSLGLLLLILALVAQGPEKQPTTTARALEDAEGANDEIEGGQDVPTPVQAPQPPPAARTISQSLARFTVWAAEGISQLLDSTGVTYTRYSETHVPYQRRRVRQRSGGANTSAAPLDED